jgi:hypothetical protein
MTKVKMKNNNKVHKTMIRSYCDCGHREIFHLIGKIEDGSEYVKCFGADRDIFYKTGGKYNPVDEVTKELMNMEVLCQCKRVRLVT